MCVPVHQQEYTLNEQAWPMHQIVDHDDYEEAMAILDYHLQRAFDALKELIDFLAQVKRFH